MNQIINFAKTFSMLNKHKLSWPQLQHNIIEHATIATQLQPQFRTLHYGSKD